MFSKYLVFAIFMGSCSVLIIRYDSKYPFIEKLVGKIKHRIYDLLSIPVTIDGLFSPDELSKYTGKNGGPIYLSILGNVFDVTKGRKHYGEGGSYSFFAGKDASKAFVTGDFTPTGLTDDVSKLSLNELGDLQDWLQMYKKDYVYKGKLIGRYYKSTGEPTTLLLEIRDKLSNLNKRKKKDDKYKTRYPPCNVEWNPESGSRFWCSNQSGGVKRDWVGVPRKFYQPGSKKYRCACINPTEKVLEGKFLPYEGCPEISESCFAQNREE